MDPLEHICHILISGGSCWMESYRIIRPLMKGWHRLTREQPCKRSNHQTMHASAWTTYSSRNSWLTHQQIKFLSIIPGRKVSGLQQTGCLRCQSCWGSADLCPLIYHASGWFLDISSFAVLVDCLYDSTPDPWPPEPQLLQGKLRKQFKKETRTSTVCVWKLLQTAVHGRKTAKCDQPWAS